MAGALGIRLSGPRIYDGVPVEERWVGEGRSELTAKDIRTALKLYRTACGLQIAVLVLIVFSLRGLERCGSRASASSRSQSTCFSR